MSKVVTRKRPPTTPARQAGGMVRSATAIPIMERPAPVNPPVESAKAMVCTGHCGHCGVSPCQLHSQLAFRI